MFFVAVVARVFFAVGKQLMHSHGVCGLDTLDVDLGIGDQLLHDTCVAELEVRYEVVDGMALNVVAVDDEEIV